MQIGTVGVIQNEYSYAQGGRESHDICMNALALWFSCFGSTDVLLQMKNLLIQTKTLVF